MPRTRQDETSGQVTFNNHDRNTTVMEVACCGDNGNCNDVAAVPRGKTMTLITERDESEMKRNEQGI
eukprot:760411-Hanusia_phi.AAC.2